MLDLGLEHLGVDVGAAGAGVEAVLKTCGESARFRMAGYRYSKLMIIYPCSTFSAREPRDPMSSGQSGGTSGGAQECCW